MKKFLQFNTTGNQTILVEVDPASPLAPAVARNEEEEQNIKVGIGSLINSTLEKANADLDDLVAAAIKANVGMIFNAVNQLASKPKATEISFGLKFTAEGDIAVAKLGGEFNYEIKLTW